MNGIFPQLALVGVLVLLNAAFAGTEMALVSLRDGQLQRLEAKGGSGAVLARLARDPNRFLATIQIGITLAGLLASASAAVSLAEPLEEALGFTGGLAGPASILLVTVTLAYLTLTFGELAPKRIAMQRAERWGLLAARPLAVLTKAATPAVWLLSRSADLVVTLAGCDPTRQRADVTQAELRDLVAAQDTFTPHQRTIIDGAFEIDERRLAEVLRPRRDVLVLDAEADCADALVTLVEAGHSRAPVGTDADLDHVVGVVHLRTLVGRTGRVADAAVDGLFLPEAASVLDALRELQRSHTQIAIVLNEHGGGEGIVTVEDLLEELVGEIYDEADRDILTVNRASDGSFTLPGRFPCHDLVDLGVDAPEGTYTTVAGLVLARLGRIPQAPGDVVTFDGWSAEVLAVDSRAISEVRLRPSDAGEVSRTA